MKEYDLVIVGAGLGGLTAAAEASYTGKRVLVIESRSEKNYAIRPQLISLSMDNKSKIVLNDLQNTFLINEHNKNQNNYDPDSFLNDFDGQYELENELENKLEIKLENDDPEKIEDEQFLDRLNYPQEHFSIKDIQNFLKRKINDSNCTFMFDSTVSKIDMDEDQIVIIHSRDPLKNEVVKFKDLVIAEGGKRNTSKLLEEYVQYQPIPERPEEKHIMAYLTVETKDGQPKPIPMNKSFAHLVHEDYHGSIYCETYNKSASKIKLCVVMHVSPEEFTKYENDKEAGIAYLKHCARSYFNEDEYTVSMTQSKKGNIEKDNLRYSTFSLNFTEVKTPAFNVKAHTVAFVGDARRSPDFYQGHGGNDAIFDGKLAAELVNKEMKIDDYNFDCQARSAIRSSVTKNTPHLRVLVKQASMKNPLIQQAQVPPFKYDKAVPMTDYGTKQRSGNVNLFSFKDSKDSDEPVDQNKVRANNVRR